MSGPFFRILGENRQQSGAENPYYGPAEMTFVHQMTVPSVAGQQGYIIPVGDWFTNEPSECVLERDSGGGFVTLTYGLDFKGFIRSGSPAAVLDLVIGFYLVAAPPAGQTFRFTWYERVLFKTPIPVAKAKLTGSPPVPDMTVKWSQNTSNAPNGITVPELTGYVVEFWRRNAKSGGLHVNALGSRQRRGPRYVPYYRGSVGLFNFTADTFSPANVGSKRQKFRVCYYNPTTFARSFLSEDVIVVNSQAKADFNTSHGAAQVRQARSVWIE